MLYKVTLYKDTEDGRIVFSRTMQVLANSEQEAINFVVEDWLVGASDIEKERLRSRLTALPIKLSKPRWL